VLGGSSMCSAASRGPGHVALTHLGRTTIGETDGVTRPRTRALAEALSGAGFETEIAPDVMAVIWEKFALNCCINAIAATTGLRGGEMVRLAELDAFQSRVIAEVMAVTEARGIRLPTPDLPAKIKAHSRKKFNKPSMLQHVEAGRRTEIDALNGALLREAAALGVPTPYNEALVALLKGRELHQRRRIHEPDLDYAAWEARIAAGEED
jgi:2-dehydropantoate 2-reductase